MRPSQIIASVALVVATCVLTGPVCAQPLGLHLSSSATLPGGPLGLKFRLGSSVQPMAGLSSISYTASATADDFGLARPSSFHFAAADWDLNDNGVHASVGYLWRDAAGTARRGAFSNAALDTINRATPFVGLGWAGTPFNSTRFKLSADVGTLVSSGSNCQGLMTCNANGGGLKLTGGNDGIRWSPFIFLGAHLDY